MSTTSRVPESYQLLTDTLRFRERASLRAPALARATGGVSRPVLTVAGRAGLTSSAGEASTQSIIQNLGRRLHMDRILCYVTFFLGLRTYKHSTVPGAALSVTGCNHSACDYVDGSTPRQKSARAAALRASHAPSGLHSCPAPPRWSPCRQCASEDVRLRYRLLLAGQDLSDHRPFQRSWRSSCNGAVEPWRHSDAQRQT